MGAQWNWVPDRTAPYTAHRRNTAVDPPELWQVPLGYCIESTPAVWHGRIYVGTRGGWVHAIGDA